MDINFAIGERTSVALLFKKNYYEKKNANSPSKGLLLYALPFFYIQETNDPFFLITHRYLPFTYSFISRPVIVWR